MKKQMEPLGIHPSNYLKVRNKRQCMFMYCLRIFCTVRKVLTIGCFERKKFWHCDGLFCWVGKNTYIYIVHIVT